MRNIYRTLQDTDAGVLAVLAKCWKVNISGLDPQAAIQAIGAAMLDPVQAERVWASLTDDQRGALQMLIGSGGKMPLAKFARLFGDIRQMGPAQIARANPLDNPASVAEALYYRGLIAQAFEQADTGPRVVVYIPPDLVKELPVRSTSYSNLGAVADQPAAFTVLETVEGAQPADTSIVDDLTTLLAFSQLNTPTLADETLAEEDARALLPHLLKPDAPRLAFLVGLGLSAGLLEIQEGRLYPRRPETRRWLPATRAVQVQALAEAWRGSTLYRDLWHVPGLHPEPGGELDEYDASVARGNVLELLASRAPRSEWWSIESFIEVMRAADPDFQRPGGDYDSWYIRNDKDEYLTGFESWDAVEGALLEFYIVGPMHWLGLVDRAEDAARLTAYGRAFLNMAPWPTVPDPEDHITLKPDGVLLISRKISRADRFQLARVTTWLAAGDPYQYRLDAASLRRAADQGITPAQIAGFLGRMLGDQPLPKAVADLLGSLPAGSSLSVTLERLMVLRTTAPETLDRIYETPALRRYLGARLGPMAVVVRDGQWEALCDALEAQGIEAEVRE